MKRIIKLLLICNAMYLLLASCGAPDTMDQPSSAPSVITNYVGSSSPQGMKLNLIVLVDQSDRLNNMQQISRDTALLSSIIKSFDARMRKNRFTVGDKLSIYFAQQKNQSFGSAIVLEVDTKARAVKWNESVAQTKDKIMKAYLNASDFKFDGADIWSFFKDNQPIISKENMENKVILITDGYHYFSKATTAKRPKGTYLKPESLAKLRRKDAVCPPSETMTPLSQFTNCQVLLLEAAPKNSIEQPFELDALKAWWQAWFSQMGIDVEILSNNPQNDDYRNEKIKSFIR